MEKLDEIEQDTSSAQPFDFETFHKKSHFWGRLTLYAVMLLTLFLPLYLSFGMGLHPGWSAIFSGFISYAAVVVFLWIIEPISYYTVLGVSGTYLAFLNGNIGNMCLPAASIAQNVVGAEPGTKKGELVATLAIASASIANIIFLLFIVLGGSFIITSMSDHVVEMISRFVLPSIFGGVIAQFAIQKPLWGLVGITLGLLIHLGPIPEVLETFLSIVGTIVVCMLLEKLKTNNQTA